MEEKTFQTVCVLKLAMGMKNEFIAYQEKIFNSELHDKFTLQDRSGTPGTPA